MAEKHPNRQSARLQFAVDIAREAGKRTLNWFCDAELPIEQKSDGTPVTLADRDAEEHLRRRIAEQFPEDHIEGEEFDAVEGTSGYRWMLDPIDGTKSFIRGVPLYTTLVAVLKGDAPQIGVICVPAMDEMIFAEIGTGCWHHVGEDKPRLAQVSQIAELSEALFLTTDVQSFSDSRAHDARSVYLQLESACRLTRTWGDAYGYLLVATGRAEVMIDPEMDLWDSAALQPVITEAGGSFTDWQGQPTIHSGDSIATNAALSEQVLAMTRGM